LPRERVAYQDDLRIGSAFDGAAFLRNDLGCCGVAVVGEGWIAESGAADCQDDRDYVEAATHTLIAGTL